MYSYDYVCVVTSYRLISAHNQYFVKKKYCNFDTYRKMSIILNCIVLSNNTTVGGGWKFDQYIATIVVVVVDIKKNHGEV